MKIRTLIVFVAYFAYSHFVNAQIDSTKTSLYLKCANEILISYPKDIDTTKITFEVEGGKVINNSVSKIIIIPTSAKSTLYVLYNGKELFRQKYHVKLVPKPEIKCVLTKDKFPKRLRIDIEPDKDFLKNCPLDSRYSIDFTAILVRDNEVVISELFTEKKQQLTQQEWFTIRELFKQNPTAKWKIIIERFTPKQMNFRGSIHYTCYPAIHSYDYGIESFER
ncbi:GldM family protein [Bernardetia sp.]|uniref:GldM family protein n=1 Tax=Bernardetia sp. TaxID=1937974 RepID=UPI0025BF726E|nr:GldM family protein [Bernardetia sp.]